MPRKSLIRTSEFPYHLRARTNNREPWPIPMDDVWEILSEAHAKVVTNYDFQSHALILMINHYHWAASTPHENVDEGMAYFQTQTSKHISKAAGRINKIYGGRYGWSVLTTPDSYQRAYRYIYMNPVRANVCSNPLDYRWSTLTDKRIKIVEPVGFTEGIPDGASAQAKWMLDLRSEDDEIRTRLALRRRVFTLPRNFSGFKN